MTKKTTTQAHDTVAAPVSPLSVWDEILIHWGPVIFPVLLATIGFTYKFAITEPRVIDEQAEQYLERSTALSIQIAQVNELHDFVLKEWHPAVVDTLEKLQRELGPILGDPSMNWAKMRTPLAEMKVEESIKRLDLVDAKTTAFVFDDLIYKTWVSGMSIVTQSLRSLLVDLNEIAVAGDSTSKAVRALQMRRCAEATRSIINKHAHVLQCEKRAITLTTEHGLQVKHYLEKTSRHELSARVCYITYTSISSILFGVLLLSGLRIVVLWIEARKANKKVS